MNKKIMENITPINDKGEKHGYWETYVFDLLYKGSYVNHKRYGYWEKNHINGNLDYRGHYINDERHGKFEFYYSNRKFVRLEYYYKDNVLHSTSKNKILK